MMYVQHTKTLSERDETELLLATRICHTTVIEARSKPSTLLNPVSVSDVQIVYIEDRDEHIRGPSRETMQRAKKKPERVPWKPASGVSLECCPYPVIGYSSV